MATEAKIQANRSNAARRKVLWPPSLAAGKVTPPDDMERIRRIRAAYRAEFLPVDLNGEFLLDRMARAGRRLQLLAALHARVLEAANSSDSDVRGLIASARETMLGDGLAPPRFPAVKFSAAPAGAARGSSADRIAEVARYQLTVERSLCRARRALAKIRDSGKGTDASACQTYPRLPWWGE